MAPVDFNFNNLRVDNNGRVTVGGVSSGIDVQGTIDGIVTARRIPIDRIRQRIDRNEGRITALGRLRGLTETLQSSLSQLRGATFSPSSDIFQSRETYLSNFRSDGRVASPPTNLLSVNVSGNASLGQNEIEIRQVARSHRIASKNFNDRTQALNLSGSIRLSLSGGEAGQAPPPPIEIDTNDSLNDIRDQINTANRGVNATGISANIIQISSTENVLVLTAQEPARDIVISGDSDLIDSAGLGLVASRSQAAVLSGPAQSQIGPTAGITSITFDGSQGTDAFQLSYEASTNNLTVTRVYDGASQSLPVGASAGTRTFSDFGITVNIGSSFDRTADITPENGVFSNPANSGAITDATIRIDRAVGDVSGFDFSRLSFDLTAQPFDPANIGVTSGTFSGTFNGSGSVSGPQSVTLSDGDGNEVVLRINVTAAFNAQATPFIALGNHTFTPSGNDGRIDPDRLSVSALTGTTDVLNHADLDFDVTDPAAITVSSNGFSGSFDGTTTGSKTLTLERDRDGDGTADDTLTLNFTVSQVFNDQGNPSISLNNHSYSSGAGSATIRDNATLRLLYTQGDISGITNNQLTFDSENPNRVEARIGNFVGRFDGSETGTKQVTLSDDQGNSLTIQFVLEDAFDSLGTPSLELDFLDTVVTSGGTAFANQVQTSQNARLAVKGLTDPSRHETDLVPNKNLPLKNYLTLAPDTGSFSIEVGGNTVVVNYNVNDANQDGTTGDSLTLEGLQTLINNAITTARASGNAVSATARIVDYTSGSRLVIENTDDPPVPVTLSDTNFLLFDLGVDDERVIERSSNTIEDLFPGLTLELLNAEEGTTIRLETRRNNAQVVENITAFVEAYNGFKQFANQQTAIDPDTGLSSGAPLFGEQALRDVETIASAAVGNGVSNQGSELTIQVLAQIGITFVNNTVVQSDLRDTLRIDEAKLNDALLNNFDNVQRLFGFDLSSSDNRVSFLGLDGSPAYSQNGYTLDLSYENGSVSAATIRDSSLAAGSEGEAEVSVTGSILRVQEGPAAGLRLFYSGDGTAPASVSLNFTTGFAQQLHTRLQAALDPVDGSIISSVQALEDRNTLSQQRIERVEFRIGLERDRLLQSFTRMEENLARAESVRESMNQLFATLTPENRQRRR